jgi:Ternary complex associated domain 7
MWQQPPGPAEPLRLLVVRGALLLDAGMSVQAAGRRLAQHGYWIDPNQPGARSWLKEYVARIAELISRAGGARPDASDRESGGHAATSTTAAPTIEDAARLLARPPEGQWAAVRRQDGVTIFWYACRVSELLQVFSNSPPEQTILESLNLHEYTSTRSVQAEDLPSSGPQLHVVLHGHDLVGIKEPDGHAESGDFEFERSYRGGVGTGGERGDAGGGAGTLDAAGPAVPAEHGAEEAAVRGFPFLDAPQKVTVGVRFELEIGLSDAPVAGVATTGQLVLHAPAGTTKIPVEVQLVAEGFSAPQGWRRRLDVAVTNPTKARVKIPLVALAQAEKVRLTSLSVHFAVGGVARGAASRNVVVEANAGSAPLPDSRGVSWLGVAEPPPVVSLRAVTFVPDIELDIDKPDRNETRGNYRCVMRNAHGVPVPDESLTIDLGEDAGTFAKTLIDQVRQYSGDAPRRHNDRGHRGADRREAAGRGLGRSAGCGRQGLTDRAITLQLNSAEPYVPWELAWVEPALDPTRRIFSARRSSWVAGSWGTAVFCRRRAVPAASARWPSWRACKSPRPVWFRYRRRSRKPRR